MDLSQVNVYVSVYDKDLHWGGSSFDTLAEGISKLLDWMSDDCWAGKWKICLPKYNQIFVSDNFTPEDIERTYKWAKVNFNLINPVIQSKSIETIIKLNENQ